MLIPLGTVTDQCELEAYGLITLIELGMEGFVVPASNLCDIILGYNV